jgi:hypothetical protein
MFGPVIRDVAKVLESCGWSVFWDRKIAAGDNWREVVADVDRARIVHAAPHPGVVPSERACVMLAYVRLGCPFVVSVNACRLRK